MSPQWIHPDSHWGSSWFCIWVEQTLKLLIPIISAIRCCTGYHGCSQLGSNWFPRILDSTATNLSLFPYGILLNSALGEKRLPRLWITFWVSQSCRKGNLGCFNSSLNWLLTILDSTVTNPPLFFSEFQLIPHWGGTDSQAIDSNYQ